MLTLHVLYALARVRGDINGKTIKLPPHLFAGDLPFPSEA